MSDNFITQVEAEKLFEMEKISTDSKEYKFPFGAGRIEVKLSSLDKRELFHLDISRGRIDLKRIKYQNRARTTIILYRLDFSGAPHRNPDGEEVPCPHIHQYTEGYDDKWAYPITKDDFSDLDNYWSTLTRIHEEV